MVTISCLLCLIASSSVALGARKVSARREAKALLHRSLRLDDLRALLILSRARKLAPGNANIVYRIGFINHKMNRRQQAKVYYRKTIRLRHCHFRALNNLGNLYLDERKERRAEKLYRRSIRCNRRFFAAYYNLGNLAYARKKYHKALYYYRTSLRYNPAHHRSRHNIASTYLQLEKVAVGRKKNIFLKRALLHFIRARKLSPNNALTRYCLARLYLRLGHPLKARIEMERAKAIAPAGSELGRKIREISFP